MSRIRQAPPKLQLTALAEEQLADLRSRPALRRPTDGWTPVPAARVATLRPTSTPFAP